MNSIEHTVNQLEGTVTHMRTFVYAENITKKITIMISSGMHDMPSVAQTVQKYLKAFMAEAYTEGFNAGISLAQRDLLELSIKYPGIMENVESSKEFLKD